MPVCTLCIVQHIVPCTTCWLGGCRGEGQLIVPLAVEAECLLNQAILSSAGLDIGMDDLVTNCTTSLLGLGEYVK